MFLCSNVEIYSFMGSNHGVLFLFTSFLEQGCKSLDSLNRAAHNTELTLLTKPSVSVVIVRNDDVHSGSMSPAYRLTDSCYSSITPGSLFVSS